MRALTNTETHEKVADKNAKKINDHIVKFIKMQTCQQALREGDTTLVVIVHPDALESALTKTMEALQGNDLGEGKGRFRVLLLVMISILEYQVHLIQWEGQEWKHYNPPGTMESLLCAQRIVVHRDSATLVLNQGRPMIAELATQWNLPTANSSFVDEKKLFDAAKTNKSKSLQTLLAEALNEAHVVVWVRIVPKDDAMKASKATAFQVTPIIANMDGLKKAVMETAKLTIPHFMLKVYAHDAATGGWVEVPKASASLEPNTEETAYHVVVGS